MNEHSHLLKNIDWLSDSRKCNHLERKNRLTGYIINKGYEPCV